MTIKFIAIFALTLSVVFSQPQQIRYDGGRQDSPGSIVTDTAGNTFIAASVDDLTKASSFAVVKYSAAGSLQWTAHYSALAEEFGGFASSVAVDAAGNTYVAGNILRRVGNFGTNVDWLVVSFSPTGAQRWVQRLKGSADNSTDSASSILLGPSGDLYVSGTSGVSDSDWSIAKYSASGAVLWQQQLAGIANGEDVPSQMAFDAAGNLIVLGDTTNIASTGRHDITVAKFSPQGSLIWRRDFSDSDLADDLPGGVAVDINGSVYVTGTTSLNPELEVDPVMIKWDANGNRIFALKGNGVGGSGIAIDSAGDIVTSGTSFTDAGGIGTISVSKLDSNGNLKWVTPLAASGIVATDFNRNVYVAGSTINAGGSDRADFFAAKLTPAGAPVWQYRYTPGLNVSGAVLEGLGEWVVAGNGPGLGSSISNDILMLKFPANFVGVPPSPPAAPTGLTASAGSKRITLAWHDQSSNEDGFRIERCQGSGCTNFVQIAEVSSNVTSFVNTGLAGKTTYTYRVRAFNANGNSAYSNTASAKAGN